jgi:hypothetical protein
VLNVERDRKEYNFTWLTKEERDQSKLDAQKFLEFVDLLQPGLVKDHLKRSQVQWNTVLRISVASVVEDYSDVYVTIAESFLFDIIVLCVLAEAARMLVSSSDLVDFM